MSGRALIVAFAVLVFAACAFLLWQGLVKDAPEPENPPVDVPSVEPSAPPVPPMPEPQPDRGPEPEAELEPQPDRVPEPEAERQPDRVPEPDVAPPTPVAVPAPAPLKKGYGDFLTDLNDENPGVRFAAAVELGKLGDTGAVEDLAESLGSDSDVFVRRAVARALGELKSWDAVPALITALDDKEVFVRTVAVKALEQITEERQTDEDAWRSWWKAREKR